MLDGYASERWCVESDYAVRLAPGLADIGVLLEPTSIVAKAWEQIERIGGRLGLLSEEYDVATVGTWATPRRRSATSAWSTPPVISPAPATHGPGAGAGGDRRAPAHPSSPTAGRRRDRPAAQAGGTVQRPRPAREPRNRATARAVARPSGRRADRRAERRGAEGSPPSVLVEEVDVHRCDVRAVLEDRDALVHEVDPASTAWVTRP